DDGGDVLKTCAGIGEERAVGLAHHARRYVLVVLVRDLADDLLDDVFDRNDAVSAAIFIDDEGEMDTGRLHLVEQVEHRHGRRRIQNFAHDFLRLQLHRQIDRLKVKVGGNRVFAAQFGGCVKVGAARHDRERVADVDHAGGVVEGIVETPEPRMARALEYLHEFAERDVPLHADDVGARHHHI